MRWKDEVSLHPPLAIKLAGEIWPLIQHRFKKLNSIIGHIRDPVYASIVLDLKITL